MFIERSFSKLKTDGKFGFVIPKSLTFSQKWNKVRNFLIDNFSIQEIADISKAFKGVLLEQIVLIVDNASEHKSTFKGHFLGPGSKPDVDFNEIPLSLCKEIDAFPIYVNETSRSIYEKIKNTSVSLGSISRTFRGLPLQSELKQSRGEFDEETLIGDDIARYSFRAPSKFLPSNLLEKEKVGLMKKVKIVSQRIVAHVTRPVDHIVIMSSLDEGGLVNVDTVENTILDDTNYDQKNILALLNSRLIGWFTYVFIYNKAIRTMDFDDYYLGKIPVAKKLSGNDETVSDLVSDMLILCRQKRHLISMVRNLLSNLTMTREEKLDFFFSSPRIAELHGISLSETSRVDMEKTGIIERYYVKLDGDYVVISADLQEEDKSLEVIRLKFEEPLLKDYFYINLRNYAGTRNYKKTQKIFNLTVNTMRLPRFAGSNLIEDSPKKMKEMMTILEKEFEKVKNQFSDSPIQKADLAGIDAKIAEIDVAIDQRIFQIYGLSQDETALIKGEVPSLTNAT